MREYVVSIKGPLTTPVGGGIRSLNVALRQELDLYVCLRPIQYFKGVPSPVKEPEKTNMVIFRENSEDIYAGIEFEAESEKAKKLIKFLIEEMGVKKIRFPNTSGIGIKPVIARRHRAPGAQGDPVRDRQRQAHRDLVHKGNIMKFTEGGFRDWGYAPGAEGVRRRADRRRPVVQVQEPEDRQGHRRQGHRSPTPSCSRSCCARPSTR